MTQITDILNYLSRGVTLASALVGLMAAIRKLVAKPETSKARTKPKKLPNRSATSANGQPHGAGELGTGRNGEPHKSQRLPTPNPSYE
jgi:hypothetical protein